MYIPLNVATFCLRSVATARRTSLPAMVDVLATVARDVAEPAYATCVPAPAALRAIPSVEIPAFQPTMFAAIGLTSMNAVAPSLEVS